MLSMKTLRAFKGGATIGGEGGVMHPTLKLWEGQGVNSKFVPPL